MAIRPVKPLTDTLPRPGTPNRHLRMSIRRPSLPSTDFRTISQVKTVFHWDERASWLKTQTLECSDCSSNWQRVETKMGWYLPLAGGADASTEADAPTVTFVLSNPVEARAVRLVNRLQGTRTYQRSRDRGKRHGEPFALRAWPGNDADLADLHVDRQPLQISHPSTMIRESIRRRVPNATPLAGLQQG